MNPFNDATPLGGGACANNLDARLDDTSLPVPDGVKPEVWARFTRPGTNGKGRACWLIDERNELGEVIGTACRYADGKKDFIPGGRRGLIADWPLDTYAGTSLDAPVFVAEGASDTAALLGLGLDAVGIPMAGQCGEPLAVLLADLHVVLVADADKAGENGARKIADALRACCRSVRIIQSPHGAKDAREAVIAGATREDFMALIEATKPVPPEPLNGDPIIVRLDEVVPEAVDWLWCGRVARGKLTLIAGDPGLGKSFLTLDMAARVSTGAGWPDDPGQRMEPAGVVLMNAEDGTADTVVPRLIAAGADLTRIIVVDGVKDRHASRAFNFERDLEALRRAILSVPGCALVVIDPVSAYLGGVDSHKNADVRGLLAPLASLASERGVAVVLVTHLNKSGGTPALYRAMGSLAFAAAARSAFVVAKDKSDEDRRLMLPMKSNLSADTGGLAFRLAGREDGLPPAIEWESEPIHATADDALAHEPPERGRTRREKAAEWLRELLSGGVMPAIEVLARAKDAGHSKRTIERAVEELHVRKRKDGMNGGWVWEL